MLIIRYLYSAQKKFKAQLLTRFPNLTAEAVDALLPKKGTITVDKLSNKRMVYWVENECPLFFDNSYGQYIDNISDFFDSLSMQPHFLHI
jgi:hypothetical protein